MDLTQKQIDYFWARVDKSVGGSRIYGFKGLMPKVQDIDGDTTDEGCKC
jgi:hypothetical protein